MNRIKFLWAAFIILSLPLFSAPITEYTIQRGAGPVTTYTEADGAFINQPQFAYQRVATIFFPGIHLDNLHISGSRRPATPF